MSNVPIPDFVRHALQSLLTGEPRPGLKPTPGTKPLTIEAVLCPVLLYYISLLLLPPPPPSTVHSVQVRFLRNVLALLAAFLFLRLPLAYHVPQSIGLTYQLGLVGLYGGLRVLDACFVSIYFWDHIPRRVRYFHQPRSETPEPEAVSSYGNSSGRLRKLSLQQASPSGDKITSATSNQNGSLANVSRRLVTSRGASQSDMVENMTSQSYTELLDHDTGYVELMQRLFNGPKPVLVIETTQSEDGWPHTFSDRAAWALELELSMRGVGFTWTTADIRHTRKTWLPTPQNRLHSILVHVGPVLVLAYAIIKTTYVNRLEPLMAQPNPPISPFDEISLPEQYLLTAALGAFLMAAFSFAHSIFAIMLSPLAPSPLAFFPPLYPTRVWEITSTRGFWAFGWHRLFARLFLVWGVWPGEWLERKLTGKTPEQPADIGKVLGGFLSSAFVHSFSVRGVVGGNWSDAAGEAKFFALNGLAVLFEEGVQRVVVRVRRQQGWKEVQWYDAWVGRVWWIFVLLSTGRNFARGWTKAGLVREMAFM